MAQHVAFNELAILFVMRHRVWTWPHNRHPPGQHIDKLRQFVQRGAAQKVPHFGDARIVLRRLSYHFVVLHHFHGTELPHFDRLAIHAVASLAENNRPR